MLDIDLLRSFVSVVDAGGFTRAGERVHRTQSTVSQQIRRLEETLGRELLHRNGKQATPTEEGERLLSYARRILALAEEARDVVAKPTGDGVVRLGIPEDFAAYRLAELLSEFARSRPGLRLDVRCGLSVRLARDLERGELDLALFKRDVGEGGGIATWPERLHWVTSRRHPIDARSGSVPLAVFEQGCLYRNRAIHALEAADRPWHVAYTSPNLPGIQAAVSAGLGVSILPDVAILADHQVLGRYDGFPPIPNTELALVAAPDATPATRRLADVLADFCNTAHARLRSGQRRLTPRGNARPRKRRAAARPTDAR
jgi:DNA-binding transcriptional LysR family regulator